MTLPIDFRSDTITRPTPAMLDAMFSAEVGDDVFNEDPTVQKLEKKTAALFGKEAGLFCPSGTMTNQIAIKLHTQPGDEVICDKLSHIYHYEGGGIAFNSGASVRLIDGKNGLFTREQFLTAINPDDIHHPVSTLLVLENTCNKGGGTVWPIDLIEDVCKAAQKNGIIRHLDGARIFNALTYTSTQPKTLANNFDTLSICLSKGLGAPVGSVLIGSADDIKRAKRIRKVFGGAMRQSGYLAAAGIYALDHHIDRLNQDHKNAQLLANALKETNWACDIIEPQTNILIFSLKDQTKGKIFLEILKNHGILAVSFGPYTFRLVTHLDVSDEQINKACEILKTIDI